MSCFDILLHTSKWLGEAVPAINAAEGEYYQFKDLGCNLSIYAINDEGYLVLVEDRSNGVDAHLHLDYDGELELAGKEDSYLVTFAKSKFVSIEKTEG